MNLQKKSYTLFASIALFILIFCALVLQWMTFKPLRMFLPSLNNVTCINAHICVDDTTKTEKASELYLEAYNFVNSSIDKIENEPRVIFCSTKECSESFGVKRSLAGKTGVLGIVITHTGWDKKIVRHEMIHHLQIEKLGIAGIMFKPMWFKEGMAYYLSTESVPHKPWAKYRAKFESWYLSIDKKTLWDEARKL